jgi:flagellar assembly factor FliW
VLNIATVKSWSPQRVTANLVAPLVVNRKTGVGKQVVLTNYQKYSVNHPLIDDAA